MQVLLLSLRQTSKKNNLVHSKRQISGTAAVLSIDGVKHCHQITDSWFLGQRGAHLTKIRKIKVTVGLVTLEQLGCVEETN